MTQMFRASRSPVLFAALAAGLLIWITPARAQDAPPAPPPPAAAQAANTSAADSASTQVQPCPVPVKQPPANSPKLLRCISYIFHPDGTSSLDPMTYVYYVKRQSGSDSSKDLWVPYNEQEILDDFTRLWGTGFLDNLWVERIDEPYENGTPAEHIVYHMEERPRLKLVDYTGSKAVEISKIEEAEKTAGITVRYDTFIDESVIRKVRQLIKELYAEKGYNDATVDVEKAPMPGGSKLLRLTFDIKEGPKFRLTDLQFDGNEAFTDKALRKQMKGNRPRSWLSFINGSGEYHETKFEEDAERVREFYQNHGYVKANVGSPQIERLRDTDNGKIREVRLRVPVDEGPQYHIGTIEIAGATAIKTEYLRSAFDTKEGDIYNRQKFVKGYEKAKEAYGAFGYMDFTMQPELTFPGTDPQTGRPLGPDPVPPVVNVKLQMTEGKQYYVNRITFVGNTTTHDIVVRRDMRLLEGGLFNTEALKESIRRINQLGYFKPIEQKDETVQVEKVGNDEGKVNVTLKVEEQNRNQLAFGAGISQFEGFFGQLSFQTANFLGRGETLGVSAQKGVQASNYQASFSEPYLFDRPISAGVDLYKRAYIYPLAYTQESTGSNVTVGVPVRNYTRGFINYAYEEVVVKDINPSLTSTQVLSSSPYLVDALLLNQRGRRRVSRITPSLVYNTVNQPIFPTAGTRYNISNSFAGSFLGGNTDYWSTTLEGTWYFPVSVRTSLGLHAQGQYIRPYGRTSTLPIFEKFFMGGEYSVRGFDIRSIGPRDFNSGIVTGGNKTVLFNAEYSINVGGPVRLIAFYDAGQVQDIGQKLKWWEPIVQTSVSPTIRPYLTDTSPLTAVLGFRDVFPTVNEPLVVAQNIIGRTSAFKTSTGLEVRFFMPVLNIPFRLIAAYNPQRFGVLDNTLRPQKAFNFRFAVGSTF
jgi:outer membrane protein insertion porin family